MIATHVPACPRCPEGGRVKLVDEQEDSGILKQPDRPLGKTLVFQCDCGWATTVRVKPEQAAATRPK
jgi:hypothetical protein